VASSSPAAKPDPDSPRTLRGTVRRESPQLFEALVTMVSFVEADLAQHVGEVAGQP
jgi:hypothetical protein